MLDSEIQQQDRPTGRETVTRRALQEMLKVRAAAMHERLRRRIPSDLRSVLSAEDVLQAVWLAAFEQIAGFRAYHDGALDRWLNRIADIQLYEHIRRLRADKRGGAVKRFDAGQYRTSYLDLLNVVQAPERTPSSAAAVAEALSSLHVALANIPGPHRQAIVMRYIHGRSWDEMASEMQESVPAIKGLLQRGMSKLRRQMGDVTRFYSDL